MQVNTNYDAAVRQYTQAAQTTGKAGAAVDSSKDTAAAAAPKQDVDQAVPIMQGQPTRHRKVRQRQRDTQKETHSEGQRATGRETKKHRDRHIDKLKKKKA